MFSYVLRRLAATIPVMLIVAVLVFLMLRLTPSDPAAIIAGDNANSEQVAEIRKRLGLDQPILTQFVIWIGKTLQGDLGESFFFKKQVTELIRERLEPTLSLALFTIILAVLIAVPLGVHCRLPARRLARPHRHGLLGAGLLGAGVRDRLPADLRLRHRAQLAAGAGLPAHLAQGVGGWLQRLILPSLTLSVIYIALIARITRTSVLEVLNEDYIRTARAKGLTERKVLMRHALANAAVPIVTVIGLGVALLIGGVVVTEVGLHDPGPGPADGGRRARPRLSRPSRP